jgi:hypothetical protein
MRKCVYKPTGSVQALEHSGSETHEDFDGSHRRRFRRRGRCQRVRARGEKTADQDAGPTAVEYGESTRHESLPGGALKVNDSVGLWVDLKALGPEDVLVTLTPLLADKPKGSKLLASTLDAFAVDSIRPTESHESDSVELDRIALQVTNHDVRDRLSAIEGRTSPGRGANVELIAIHVQDPTNESRPIPGVAVVMNGNAFTISGLALGPTQRCEVVAVFSGVFDAHKISVTITGTFDAVQ